VIGAYTIMRQNVSSVRKTSIAEGEASRQRCWPFGTREQEIANRIIRRNHPVKAAGVRPARAQQSERMRRIGLLMLVGKADPQAHAELAAFTTELQRLGWTEGQNVRIDYRWADGDVSRLQALAAQLVELRPDLVVAQGSAALAALRQATRALPIVFADVTDPVGQGL